jgi:endonuclease G
LILRRYIANCLALAALLSLPVLAVSCGDSGKEIHTAPPTITIRTNPADHQGGSQFIEVVSVGDWSIVSSESWLSVTPSSGSSSSNTIVLAWTENTGEEDRSATITVTNQGGSASVKFTQNKKPVIPSGGDGRGYGDAAAKVRWLELPETSATDPYEFFTHDMEVLSVKTRNYSFYWDYDNLVAKWVAYPLCGWNIGSSVKRTDAWNLDPLLPVDKQPVLYSTYGDGNTGWRARGHQIASADRLTSYASNSMTFYFTNMTPQINDTFNSSVWATLEGMVRNWAYKSDTLYVVTGCVPEGSTQYCTDNLGKKVTVPVGYFKAVLRYQKSSTIGYSGYMGCAFYMEHKNYSGSAVSKSMSMSISDLEKKLGYGLFVNLTDKVDAVTAKKIKDENPSTVSWWW